MIFRALRESRGFSYAANAGFDWPEAPDEQGFAIVDFGTHPGRVAEALDIVLDVVRKDIEPTAFDEARSRLEAELRSYRVSPLEVPRRVLQWERQGFENDPQIVSWSGSSKLALAEFSEFHRTVTSSPVTIIVAGDAERMDLERLETVAAVRRVEPADIIRVAPIENPRAGQ